MIGIIAYASVAYLLLRLVVTLFNVLTKPVLPKSEFG